MDGPYYLTKYGSKNRIKGHWYYFYSKGELELRYCINGKTLKNIGI